MLQEADGLKDFLQQTRRELHQMPELGFDLKNTIAYVKKILTELGIDPIDCGKAGVVALIGGNTAGKVFLLRADMDALPMKEEADVEFASQNENMHACGHDMHTAMLLGAAKLLKDHEEELQGTVKLMFQPAEELLEGAQDMVDAGVLENPKVDGAMMLHVMAGMPLPEGTALVSAPGISAPAADYFEIKVQGKGCHGAMPNTGIDPLTASAHILIGLQEIQARELAAKEQGVLTIGMLQAGKASNVIPDDVTMGGTMRASAEETRELLKSRLVEITQGIAKSFRTEASVTFTKGCPTLVNNKDLSLFTSQAMKTLLGEEKVIVVEGAGGGSDDFSYITHKVPSVMVALAAGHPEKGYGHPQHHPMVKFDESVLAVGSAVYAYTAMEWLKEGAQQ